MSSNREAKIYDNAPRLSEFQSAGIPMIKKTGDGIMHWKTMIFAGQDTVEFGSANYSPNAFVPDAPYTNYVSETIFFSDDPNVVHSFKKSSTWFRRSIDTRSLCCRCEDEGGHGDA